MANIQIPVISLTNKINKVQNFFTADGTGFATYATGVSTVNGTHEIFEIEFPSVNESCYIYIANKNVAAVQAKVLSGNAISGFVPSNYTIGKNKLCILAFNPFYVQNDTGKIEIEISPNASTTVGKCGVQVVGVYSNDTSTSIAAPLQLVDADQLSSDLKDVADAIRTRGGTSATLAFPTGFVTAINELSTVSDTPIEITPSSSAQTVNIPTGYDGVSDVTVLAVPVDASHEPGGVTDNGVYYPASGKYFDRFIVNIPEYNGASTQSPNTHSGGGNN